MTESDHGPSAGTTLTLLPERLSIYRFHPDTPLAEVGTLSGLWSITRTPQELSVVAAEDSHPAADEEDRGWRCLYVDGPIPFDLTGIVAGLTSTIAAQDLGVFVLSTFDSDLLLVRDYSLDQSLQALRDEGYDVRTEGNTLAPTTHAS
ncbi:ACT domain-containing protein [Arthrobacter sp. MDB2-24]